MVAGSRVPSPPGTGGAWGLPRLLPVKRSWHFRARQRRWLPALEVSIWPLSQHRLPSPSPLTSADPDRGSQLAIVILPAPQWGHSGALQRPLGRAHLPPRPGCPWPQPSPVWVGVRGGGVWLWRKQLAARGNVTEDWIVDGGHRNVPHVTGPRGALPSLCLPPPAGAAGLPRSPHLRPEPQGLPSVRRGSRGD